MSQRNITAPEPANDTSADGLITLRGQVVGGGAPCVQFRTDNGRQISLEGASPRNYPIGERFELTGHFVAISRCMQGPGFVVATQDTYPDN